MCCASICVPVAVSASAGTSIYFSLYVRVSCSEGICIFANACAVKGSGMQALGEQGQWLTPRTKESLPIVQHLLSRPAPTFPRTPRQRQELADAAALEGDGETLIDDGRLVGRGLTGHGRNEGSPEKRQSGAVNATQTTRDQGPPAAMEGRRWQRTRGVNSEEGLVEDAAEKARTRTWPAASPPDCSRQVSQHGTTYWDQVESRATVRQQPSINRPAASPLSPKSASWRLSPSASPPPFARPAQLISTAVDANVLPRQETWGAQPRLGLDVQVGATEREMYFESEAQGKGRDQKMREWRLDGGEGMNRSGLRGWMAGETMPQEHSPLSACLVQRSASSNQVYSSGDGRKLVLAREIGANQAEEFKVRVCIHSCVPDVCANLVDWFDGCSPTLTLHQSVMATVPHLTPSHLAYPVPRPPPTQPSAGHATGTASLHADRETGGVTRAFERIERGSGLEEAGSVRCCPRQRRRQCRLAGQEGLFSRPRLQEHHSATC